LLSEKRTAMRNPPLLARWLVGAVASASVAIIACGTSATPESGFDDPGDTNAGDGSPGTVSKVGTIGAPDSSVDGGGISITMEPGTTPEASTVTMVTPNCSGTSAAASRKPVKLVVVLDQSWSMGGDPKTDDGWNTRWLPVTQALESFFSDSGSKGISASLTLFPLGGLASPPGNASPMCLSDYTDPGVSFTALPTSGINVFGIGDPFVGLIDSNGPEATENTKGVESDTPTKNALAGAYAYANAQAKADTSGAAYAVVLVTDGDPCGCDYVTACPSQPGYSAANVTAAAKDIASSTITPETTNQKIPTYVIGIGDDAANLDTFAAAGGTGTHIQVDTGDPDKTKSELDTALDGIRTESISCSYPIPPVPNGQTYDLDDVNVLLDGNALAYSADCTGSTPGWHYDSLTTPTQIELCDATCTGVKDDADASVQVVFGCMTTTVIPGYDGGITVR
jgi:hypothetical protein